MGKGNGQKRPIPHRIALARIVRVQLDWHEAGSPSQTSFPRTREPRMTTAPASTTPRAEGGTGLARRGRVRRSARYCAPRVRGTAKQSLPRTPIRGRSQRQDGRGASVKAHPPSPHAPRPPCLRSRRWASSSTDAFWR